MGIKTHTQITQQQEKMKVEIIKRMMLGTKLENSQGRNWKNKQL